MNIAILDLCESYHIDRFFLESLHNNGLISIEEQEYVSADQLELIEKFIRLHFDMEINIEGIEAINHLLQKVAMLQNEIVVLRNRLRIYEGDVFS